MRFSIRRGYQTGGCKFKARNADEICDNDTGQQRRPGFVTNVEAAIGQIHCLTHEAVRLQLWRNLRALTSETGVGRQLPPQLRTHLASV
jgi:hypothetical protein